MHARMLSSNLTFHWSSMFCFYRGQCTPRDPHSLPLPPHSKYNFSELFCFAFLSGWRREATGIFVALFLRFPSMQNGRLSPVLNIPDALNFQKSGKPRKTKHICDRYRTLFVCMNYCRPLLLCMSSSGTSGWRGHPYPSPRWPLGMWQMTFPLLASLSSHIPACHGCHQAFPLIYLAEQTWQQTFAPTSPVTRWLKGQHERLWEPLKMLEKYNFLKSFNGNTCE